MWLHPSVHSSEGNYKITEAEADATARKADEKNNQVIFKNCAPFTVCTSETNNKQVDNTKGLDVTTLMYNLIENSDVYAKTWGSLWQHHIYGPNDNITDSESSKFKSRITGKLPLLVTPNMLNTLTNCEIYLMLTWSANCVISNSTGAGAFGKTDTKLYILLGTWSIQDNENYSKNQDSI